LCAQLKIAHVYLASGLEDINRLVALFICRKNMLLFKKHTQIQLKRRKRQFADNLGDLKNADSLGDAILVQNRPQFPHCK
jgi:hypothetical protein